VAMKRPAYEEWTMERYRAAVANLLRLRSAYLLVILIAWAAVGILFWSDDSWTFSTSLWWTTSPGFWWVPIAWCSSFPMLLIAGWGYFVGSPRTLLFMPLAPARGKSSDVVFTLLTLGSAPSTVANSVASVCYWTSQHPEVSFRTNIWVVVEEKGYLAHKAQFDAIEGARIVIVPLDFETTKGTGKKARAHYYATQERRAAFPDLEHTWVYHHDDETALGEDAIFGIDEFVRVHAGERAIGYGVILYDQCFSWRPSQVQELTRTSNDLSSLTFIDRHDNAVGMYHGSHSLIRADIEDDFGWDIGPGTISEDLLLDIGAHRLGATFYALHGFAHEQAALTVRDQLKQRRRWIQEALGVYGGEELPLSRRVVAVYSYGVWFMSGATIPLMFASLWFHIGSLVAGTLFGFIWASMLTSYHRSWMLHRAYVDHRWTASAVTWGIVGALADGFAPWYAVFTRRPKHFEVVAKDAPHV